MSSRKKTRFAYLSGPVNGPDVYDAWAKRTGLEYFGTSYLTQFYQLCAEYDAEGYVITTLAGGQSRQHLGDFIIENRPSPGKIGGILYHVACCFWIIRMVPSLVRFWPDVLIITAGHNYWVFLAVLKLFGVTIIPAIHDSLWRRFEPLKLSWRILRRIEALFFALCVNEVIVAAETTAEQVRVLAGRKKVQIEVFLPTYERLQFAGIKEADFSKRPFNILFMGRMVVNKGIYDLVEIAASLNPREFHVNMCGDGPELASLRRKVEERGLRATVSCRGFLDRKELYTLIDVSHAVIVPTTTDFEEGFNMVCAEAILSDRPVITSAVCPALGYIRAAAIEVPPNDLDKYREAVVELSAKRDLYEQKRSACKPLQEQFYDLSNSWGAKLRQLLGSHIAIRERPDLNQSQPA